MCIHHLVLGNLLENYTVNITFSDESEEIFDVELAPISPNGIAIRQEKLDELYSKYKNIPSFSKINAVVYSQKKHDGFKETWLGLCLEQSKIIYNKLSEKGDKPKLCECPIIETEGGIKPIHSDYKIHDNIEISEIHGMKHFYLRNS